jgi:hypothetical protein
MLQVSTSFMAILTFYFLQDEEKKNYLSLHGIKFVYVQEAKAA